MYRCEICKGKSESGQQRRVHCLYRVKEGRQEIAQEIAVCKRCEASLKDGVLLETLIKKHAQPLPEVLTNPYYPPALPLPIAPPEEEVQSLFTEHKGMGKPRLLYPLSPKLKKKRSK